MTIIAQITDLHIREPGRLAYKRINTAAYLERAVNTLMTQKQKVDALIVTGDLCDFGRESEYDHLQRLLQPLDCPVYLMPGNHDNREQLRRSFDTHTYLQQHHGEQIYYSVKIGVVQLIALDTAVLGKSYGELDKTQLQWLDRQLSQSRGAPVIIAMHHPPFNTLIGHMDKIGLLKGATELAEIVKKYPNVERVICGHLHRSIDVRFAGTIASTAPSVAHQVALDIDPNAASCWVLEPPAYKLHIWQEDGPLVSHLAYVDNYDGPYPFYENGQLID